MKRLLLITLLIGYIYPCVAQDKPIRTEESLEGTVIYKRPPLRGRWLYVPMRRMTVASL